MHWDGWHMGGMWLWWLLVIATVAAAIWFVTRTSRPGGSTSEESPEQILKRRYAKGEIDKDTYQEMLADLRK